MHKETYKNKLFVIYYFIIVLFSQIEAQVKVLCVGNSITWGSGLQNPSTDSYPSQLKVLLGNDYTVENRGSGGRTLLKNTELPYIGSDQWKFSIATPHDIVIILLGTNDSDADNWVEKDHFKADYYELIEDYKNFPGNDPVFILGLPPPVFDESAGHRNEPIINEIIPLIKQVASELNLTIANFYNALDGKPELFIDGVHPNRDGAALMATVAYNAIQEAISIYDPPPDTPTGLKTISGQTNIKLEWHANIEDDLFSYTIYRSDMEGGVQNWIGNVIKPDTTFTDNNVILNHIYYYAIDAMDIRKHKSSRTAAIAGKTIDQSPPLPPNNLQVILEADSVKVDWTPGAELDLEKYYIFRNPVLTNLEQSSSITGTVYAPKSEYIDLDHKSATNYYYGVKAVDISGNLSPISNIVNITTLSRPLSSDVVISLYEDIPHFFNESDFPFSDADGHQLDKIIFYNSNYLNYFTCNEDSIEYSVTCNDISKLKFTPKLNEFGESYASFDFKVVDSFGSASVDTNTAIINLEAINDAPHIAPIADLHFMEDSKNILIPITGINAGPVNELQNISIIPYSEDISLITVQSINYSTPNDTGSILIDPIENIFGVVPMTVLVQDDGGIDHGGIDTFFTKFNLHISPINDPPIFNLFEKIEIFEDEETIIELTGIQSGPWETGQNINISVISNNVNILPHPKINYTSPDTTATLTFTIISNVFGSTSITITMSDDGGTEFGGKDSTAYTIPVEVISVNDKPLDFKIIAPTVDSTLVINKSNYLDAFSISWETSTDIENDPVFYDIIFEGDLSTLSRHSLSSTKTEYVLKDVLAISDTVSIASGTYRIIASDGYLETEALNSGMNLTIDGRSFAPAKLHLDQNYPNPFNNFTTIGFDLPKRTIVSIIIYDLLGEEIIRLIDNKNHDRGYNTIKWNGLDKHNNIVTAGIYIVQIRMGTEIQNKKLVFLK